MKNASRIESHARGGTCLRPSLAAASLLQSNKPPEHIQLRANDSQGERFQRATGPRNGILKTQTASNQPKPDNGNVHQASCEIVTSKQTHQRRFGATYCYRAFAGWH